MIDTSKITKETNAHEEYVIRWLNDNGFNGRVTHQWTSETAFEVEKDGVKDDFRLTAANQRKEKCNIEEYMKQFEKSFAMKAKIVNVEKALKK